MKELMQSLVKLMPIGYRIYRRWGFLIEHPEIHIYFSFGKIKKEFHATLYVYEGTGNNFVLSPYVFFGEQDVILKIVEKMKTVLESKTLEEVISRLLEKKDSLKELTAIKF